MPEPFSATAPIKSLSGTATNPGVAFTGDEDTGLYRSGANELAVTVGGAEAAKFTATGMEIDGDISLDDGGTYTTTLQTITPTAARTISFPDATGTIGLVGGSTGNLVVNQSGAYAGVANSSVDNATGNITLGSRFISNLNGAASAPPGAFTGTWFTGGTSTTTKPQVVIEPTGTTSTAWSTNGTGFGVNAPAAFAGNLLDLQVNGTSQLRVSSVGSIFNGPGGVIENFAFIKCRGDGKFEIQERVDLFADAVNVFAQRRATNAQTFRLYNTFTSGTNFERLNVRWTTNEAILDTEAGGAGGTLRGLKIGSASTSLLGFYGATPAVQPTAVANITTTATAGTLPTPDGTVTIADATTPTVTELLEYCVELESKLEAALAHLRTLGLIAT